MTGTSLIATMASRFNMDPAQFARTLRATVMPSDHTDEQFAAFLMVASQYNLNPITREIYAYPARKGGGINPVVSVDGWVNLVNSHPQCNGFEISYGLDDKGKLASATCTMWRKDREHPIVVTEHLSECYRNTDPWNTMPKRMLRHKAFKEAARYAFGFAGIADEDEAMDVVASKAKPIQLEPVDDDLDAFVASHQHANQTSAGVDPSGAAGSDGPQVGEPAPHASPSEEAAAAADDPINAEPTAEEYAAEMRAHAISVLLKLAGNTHLPAERRLADLEDSHDAFPEVAENFLRKCIQTAGQVVRGELKTEQARKFLESLP